MIKKIAGRGGKERGRFNLPSRKVESKIEVDSVQVRELKEEPEREFQESEEEPSPSSTLISVE